MKIIEQKIFPFQQDDFFSPIRSKIDYAKLLALSARAFLIDYNVPNVQTNCKMKLVVDKMSRLFFYMDRKYFSISFPFIVTVENNKVVEITTYTGKTVNNKSISAVISILDDEYFRINPSLLDFYIDTRDFSSMDILLLEEIFQSEPSYLRYDNDADNENGKLHPLNHLDINYSSYGTYKLGLSDIIIESYFENIVNISTNCSFLND